MEVVVVVVLSLILACRFILATLYHNRHTYKNTFTLAHPFICVERRTNE